jgi:hypothetical protein
MEGAAPEAGGGDSAPADDGGPDGDAFAAVGDDASDASDALDAAYEAEADTAVAEAGLDVAPPTVTEIWVHWPMPNPDAAIAPTLPSLDAALPHPMAYTAGDAGQPVFDRVTHLTWEAVATRAPSYVDAELYCLSLAQTTSMHWRVPTRIELVSLIDFTRVPTINSDVFAFPADAGAADPMWTWSSSLALPDADPTMSDHWAVSFADGSVATGSAARWVLCVNGGS